MHNSIIVEGPDGAGKSTVIERLGLTRVHTLAYTPDGTTASPPRYYRERVLDHHGRPLYNTGFDRLHLSEFVYGPLLREGSAVNSYDIDRLTQVFREKKVPIVMVLTDWVTSRMNVRSRPAPDYQTDEFLRRAYDTFVMLADSEWVDFVYTWGIFGSEIRRSKGLPLSLLGLL